MVFGPVHAGHRSEVPRSLFLVTLVSKLQGTEGNMSKSDLP